MTKDDLRLIRYSQVIKDPFPEHSTYESLLLSYSRPLFKKWLGKVCLPEPPLEISIWHAYKIGYEKAYKEIEDSLK